MPLFHRPSPKDIAPNPERYYAADVQSMIGTYKTRRRRGARGQEIVWRDLERCASAFM